MKESVCKVFTWYQSNDATGQYIKSKVCYCFNSFFCKILTVSTIFPFQCSNNVTEATENAFKNVNLYIIPIFMFHF